MAASVINDGLPYIVLLVQDTDIHVCEATYIYICVSKGTLVIISI